MQNDWLSQKSAEIEAHAASNNSKEFYRSLNAIYNRQSSTGSAPLTDANGEHLITDKGKVFSEMVAILIFSKMAAILKKSKMATYRS